MCKRQTPPAFAAGDGTRACWLHSPEHRTSPALQRTGATVSVAALAEAAPDGSGPESIATTTVESPDGARTGTPVPRPEKKEPEMTVCSCAVRAP